MNEAITNTRDGSGNWRPETAIEPAPINAWPPEPVKTLKWFFGWPGFIWPENILWLGISTLSWIYITPDLTSMKTFELWWIGALLAKNFALILALFGGLHYYLYIRHGQGERLRYTTKPFPTDSGRFKFRDQVKDNVFHTLASAVPVITGFEAITYWLFANGHLGWFNFSDPVAFWGWFVFALVLAPFIHSVHFYLGHRLLHTKQLYKRFHALHHNNVQVGPWSGLSMHPIEHLIYFSSICVQWAIALHPLNALYQLHLAAFMPAPGHSGFERTDICKGIFLAAGSKFHYQHHKYFECNYGGSLLPLDKWFGTFHDGTEAATVKLREQVRAKRRANAVS